jgi:hypothetical protein
VTDIDRSDLELFVIALTSPVWVPVVLFFAVVAVVGDWRARG